MSTKTATRRTRALTSEDFIDASDWPTVREVAETYGLGLRWLQKQVAARKFRAVRLNVLRIDPEDFVRWLNEINDN